MPTVRHPSGPPASPDPDRVGSAGTPFGPGRSDPGGPGAHRAGRGDAGRNPTVITRPTVATGGPITVVVGPPGGVAGLSRPL